MSLPAVLRAFVRVSPAVPRTGWSVSKGCRWPRLRGVRHSTTSSSSSCSSGGGGLSLSKYPALKELGLREEELGVFAGKWGGQGEYFTSANPASNEPIARVRGGTVEDYRAVVGAMDAAHADWASKPAPLRGEIVRKIGDALRSKRTALGTLISLGTSHMCVHVWSCPLSLPSSLLF